MPGLPTAPCSGRPSACARGLKPGARPALPCPSSCPPPPPATRCGPSRSCLRRLPKGRAMASEIAAANLKRLLSEPSELALIDVREHGQFGAGHAFFAVPLPYSRFELGLPSLVPNPHVRLILCDGGDGVA